MFRPHESAKHNMLDRYCAAEQHVPKFLFQFITRHKLCLRYKTCDFYVEANSSASHFFPVYPVLLSKAWISADSFIYIERIIFHWIIIEWNFLRNALKARFLCSQTVLSITRSLKSFTILSNKLRTKMAKMSIWLNKKCLDMFSHDSYSNILQANQNLEPQSSSSKPCYVYHVMYCCKYIKKQLIFLSCAVKILATIINCLAAQRSNKSYI